MLDVSVKQNLFQLLIIVSQSDVCKTLLNEEKILRQAQNDSEMLFWT